MDKAEAFFKTFRPYQRKYAAKDTAGFFDAWHTLPAPLTADLVRQAITGTLALAYFSTTARDSFAVDIDAHHGQGDGYLLTVYSRLNTALGVHPSALFKSPRGLHAYYFLSDYVPEAILLNLVRDRLKGIPVECRPTTSQALRIPAEPRAVDPVTMQPLNLPFDAICQDIERRRFHPSELFSTDILPAGVRESLRTRKRKAAIVRASPRLERLEAELLPIRDGDSNDVFVKLVYAYRSAGLDEDQALYRMAVCLVQSPMYHGELKDERRLRQRVKSVYSKTWKAPEKAKAAQPELLDAPLIDTLAALSPFARQRDKPIRRFLQAVLQYRGYHDSVMTDPKTRGYYNYLYPYYLKNRREGYYPLPYVFLVKANGQYESLMPWLISIGWIEPAPYQYSNLLGICKYYRFHDQGFLA
jgi:hypothetical protein